jgi:hypothetical protein
MVFFADENDVPILLRRFNDDPEIAFVVRGQVTLIARPSHPVAPEFDFQVAGPAQPYAIRRRAVHRLETLADGDHDLWHHVGSPLTRTFEGLGPDDDPFQGWLEVTGDEPRCGRLGDAIASSSLIHLQLYSRHRPYTTAELRSGTALASWWTENRDFLAASQVSWIGNRYASIGAPAHPATVKWWNRLRRWMKATATPLKVDPRVTFYAFPSALEKLHSGIDHYAFNWNLGPALKSVRP